jgi:hypothetical protein
VHAPACPRHCAPAAVLLPALTPVCNNLVWCVCVCALWSVRWPPQNPPRTTSSGPSTAFRCLLLGCFVGVKNNQSTAEMGSNSNKSGPVHTMALPAIRLLTMTLLPAMIVINCVKYLAPSPVRFQYNMDNAEYLSTVLLPDASAVHGYHAVVPSTRPTASPSSPPIPRTLMVDAVLPPKLKRGSTQGCLFKHCSRKSGPFMYILTVRVSVCASVGHHRPGCSVVLIVVILT